MTTQRGAVHQITNSSGTTTIACASLTTVYTASFQLRYGLYFGIWIKATSGTGTPNLKIQLEEGYKAPTTEGSSDTLWVIADGVPDIYSGLNDQTAHIKTITPCPMKHGRLKITGLGANPADTTLDARIFIQELF